jgi:lipopolysaccharide transport system permease protein
VSGRIYEVAPRRGGIVGVNFAELWAYRDLAWLLALRDIRLRYRQTVFGIAWALIQPLAATLVFFFIFGKTVGLTGGALPYGVFVLSGIALWGYFSSGLEGAATSLVDDRELLTRVWFPRLLAPVGAVVPGLLDLLVALVALAVLMAVEGVAPGPALLTLPFCLLATAILAVGVGSLLCAVNIKYRDVKHTLPFALQLWFFATPIVFTSSLVDGAARWLLAANPVCGLVDWWRWAAVQGPAPLVVGVVLVVVGLLYFRRAEGRFADVV